jgi:hypothetical protein
MRLTPSLCVAAAVLSVVLCISSPASATAGSCGQSSGSVGSCASGEIAGSGVSLKAKDDRPLEPQHPSSDPGVQQGQPQAQRPAAPPPVPRGRVAADVDVRCQPGAGACFDGEHAFLPPARWPAKPADPAPVAAVTPGVSLADVAQFVPHDASIRSQPNGWALVGAPVNLFTDATAQVVDGTLLGRPAQVRFVPVSFTWDHGDGTVSTTVGPGASWKQLGQQDFTSTDTSHAYPSIGDRRVAVTIAYSPSYRFDGGAWQQIPGTLPVQVGPVMIHVLQGSTVLVGGVCGTRNAGPGC